MILTAPFGLGREIVFFSVKSTYSHLCNIEASDPNKWIWKSKIPLKIKTFVWLTQQGAILTRDNLMKRNWHGDGSCNFCQEQETAMHLFFTCPVAKYIWSLVAYVLEANCRPGSFDQFWLWTKAFLPKFQHFHMVGLAAICWPLWKSRNVVCFDKKKELVCSASAFISFWAGLQKADNREQLETGAAALKDATVHFHHKGSAPGDAGEVLIQ